ncbi:MAG: ribonuclease Z [Bacteroidaceae bacterium]|nr:ribonuclease Z [Bacteroidaceae bacterium]
METFEVHILGCGSALPTTRHNATSQIVRIGNKQFMIDCGEGTQLQMRRSHIHFSFVNHIFISHLHGDHCFGLIGLISTFGLLGRTAPLHIYADPLLQRLMQPQLNFFCNGLKYPLHFHDIDATKQTVIYEDKSITVETIPLQHRIPCCGFLFREKPKKRHLIASMVEYYDIPIHQRANIKEGNDYTTPDGTLIPNSRLTTDADPSRSYAFCSDTLPCPNIVEQIREIDLLYHEATFAEAEHSRAQETFHSTAQQAAHIAKEANVKQLVIGHFSSRYKEDEQLLNEAKEIFPTTSLADEERVFNIE